MQKKDLRKIQLIQEFLEKKGKISTAYIEQPTAEELKSEKCYFDYSPPLFHGDKRLSCQHIKKDGNFKHREFILVVPNTHILSLLGRENALRGKALEEYYNGYREEIHQRNKNI